VEEEIDEMGRSPISLNLLFAAKVRPQKECFLIPGAFNGRGSPRQF